MTTDVNRALESIGGAEAAQRAVSRRREGIEYIESHYDALMRDYPEHWIAVWDSRVVAAELTLDDLARRLQASDYPIGEVVIREMTARPQVNFF